MDTNNELKETKVSTSIDPKTGIHNVMANFEKIDKMSEEELHELFTSEGTPDEFLGKSIVNTLGDFGEDNKDLFKFNKLLTDYRYGRIDKIKFKDLPEFIQTQAKMSLGSDPKVLAAFTNEYVNDTIKTINEESANKAFTHDIDTGEGKTYDEMYNEQFETFGIANTDEGESELYKVFIDAINFNTLTEECKTTIPRYRKLYKHLDRLEKSYEHIYAAKRTSMASLSPTNIPFIIDRHFILNNIEGYEFIHYELLQMVFLNYVVNTKSMSVSELNDHMFMYMTVKSIYDLDYLDKDGEIYPKVLNKIKNMIELISNQYDITTLQ